MITCKTRVELFLLLGLMTLIFSCRGDGNTLVIAQQYGLAYAPVQIMKEMGYLEKEMPDSTVKWIRLANTAAIREAALAGDVDAGFMGIPPFLIALDQGMPWKLLCGLSQAPLGLVVPSQRYASLREIPKDARVALPQPGSIQHILLGMALKKERGEAGFLDDHLTSLKHPDGMNALLSGALDGHFTSPPYIFQESDTPGFEILITGEEAMEEPFTFIAAVMTQRGAAKNPAFPRALESALQESILFMKENPSKTLEILSNSYQIEEDILRDYLARPGMIFETELRGVEGFIDFMTDEGYLRKGGMKEGYLF